MHEMVVRRLQEYASPYSKKHGWPVIEQATGVPLATIIKIGTRQTAFPRYKTLAPLAEYFNAKQAPRVEA